MHISSAEKIKQFYNLRIKYTAKLQLFELQSTISISGNKQEKRIMRQG